MPAANALVTRLEHVVVAGAEIGDIRSRPMFCRGLCDVARSCERAM